ncbi:hypothetical protein [Changpingibacter yushuensis]|uniref:hypothetical protein n=1 Tax=Changpingibacter yushuensis TaxID=2758440 RepID=UPI00165D8D8B|nr:hypothetical protein [Changpingibacter yushuensis]
MESFSISAFAVCEVFPNDSNRDSAAAALTMVFEMFTAIVTTGGVTNCVTEPL